MTKVTTHSDLLNEFVGEKGSASRERFEAELRVEILAAKIKEMRLKRHLTQEQLGVLVGKDRSRSFFVNIALCQYTGTYCFYCFSFCFSEV